jgi:UDP-N-acetylglucosamine:LPS N-acetylglucosamine transferase/serine/threonine protein kinase
MINSKFDFEHLSISQFDDDLSELYTRLSSKLHDIEHVNKIVHAYTKLMKQIDLLYIEKKQFQRWLLNNIYYVGSSHFNHNLLFDDIPEFENHEIFQKAYKDFVAAIVQDAKPQSAVIKKIKRIAILFNSGSGGGHKAPATAIAAQLQKQGHSTKVIDVDELVDKYSIKIQGITISQVYGEIFQKQGDVQKARFLWKRFRDEQPIAQRRYLGDLKNLLLAYKTDHIFAVAHHKPEYSYASFQLGTPLTYVHTDFSFNQKLVSVAITQAELQNPLINFTALTSEVSFLHPLLKQSDDYLHTALIRQIVCLDFPVRESFRAATASEVKLHRLSLKISDDTIVCKLAMGQNALTEEIVEILDRLIQEESSQTEPLFVFVICGKNEDLRRYLEEMLSKNMHLKYSKLQIRILGFLQEREMAFIDTVADVWITKAGGSTTAELIQTQKQMLVIKNERHSWEMSNASYAEKLQLAGELQDDRTIMSQLEKRIQIAETLDCESLPKSNWKSQLRDVLNHADADKFAGLAKKDLNPLFNREQLANIVRCINSIFLRCAHFGNFTVEPTVSGLPCTLQYDTQTKIFFIHPQKAFEQILGQGVCKIVTRSFAYDPEMPHTPMAIACLRVKNILNQVEHEKRINQFQVEALFFGKIKDAKYLASAIGITHDGKVLRVMQKIHSRGALGDLVRKRAFNLQEKIATAIMMLNAFAELSVRDLVHRDIHLHNFIVDEFFHVTLTDFGRAQSTINLQGVLAQHTKEHTAPEALFFEGLQGIDYERVDLFALGCCLFEIYTGHKLPVTQDPTIQFKPEVRAIMNEGDRRAMIAYYEAILDNQFTAKRDFLAKKIKSKRPTEDDIMQYLICNLLHTNPKKRRDAIHWLKLFKIFLPKIYQKPTSVFRENRTPNLENIAKSCLLHVVSYLETKSQASLFSTTKKMNQLNDILDCKLTMTDKFTKLAI